MLLLHSTKHALFILNQVLSMVNGGDGHLTGRVPNPAEQEYGSASEYVTIHRPPVLGHLAWGQNASQDLATLNRVQVRPSENWCF